MPADQSSVSAKELQESGNHFWPLSSDNNVSTTLLTLPREQVSLKPHKASIHSWNENTDSEQMPSAPVRGQKSAGLVKKVPEDALNVDWYVSKSSYMIVCNLYFNSFPTIDLVFRYL